MIAVQPKNAIDAPLRFEQVSKMYRQQHANQADGDLWALRNVSFECHGGEVVGLVGRNGCGKSTLLKLAAGVVTPTSGRVTTTKPIAPMLELGAGFHPDLTGRDNIRLNGSLLGLGRKLTKAQFDEILAFAELEQHVDTPVKHYSSGMSARLGFAIAVHSPARLLLVDEVLSVGDKLFQQKCLARMNQLRDQGTTILLVSHDDWWVRNFCTRALLIDSGEMLMDSTPDEILRQYDLHLYKPHEKGVKGVSIDTVDVFDVSGEPIGPMISSSIRVRIGYNALDTRQPWTMVVRVRREDGLYCAVVIREEPGGRTAGTAIVEIDDLRLVVGAYCIEVTIEDRATLAELATQVSKPFYSTGMFDLRRGFNGVFRVRDRWSAE